MIRVIVFPLSFLLFGLGFVGVVFGRRRRALHDVAARTVVVTDTQLTVTTASSPSPDCGTCAAYAANPLM